MISNRGNEEQRQSYMLRWLHGFLAIAILSCCGCQCWGPTSTCLRQEGPVLSVARRLRQQHLERSAYQRVIPSPYQDTTGFDPSGQYSANASEPTMPSRFHPVPTRNVFHPPVQQDLGFHNAMPPLEGPYGYNGEANGHVESAPGVISGGSVEGRNTGPGNRQMVPSPGRSSSPELTEPLQISPSIIEPDIEALPPPKEVFPNPVESGDLQNTRYNGQVNRRVFSTVSHQKLIQYPYLMDANQGVSDWVRGTAKEEVKVPTVLQEPPYSQRQSQGAGDPLSINQRAAGRNGYPPLGGQTSLRSVPTFAPPVYAGQYLEANQAVRLASGQQESESVLGRVRNYGPNPEFTQPMASKIPPLPAGGQQVVPGNGVPYFPLSPNSHTMFQNGMAGRASGGQADFNQPVTLHSAIEPAFTQGAPSVYR